MAPTSLWRSGRLPIKEAKLDLSQLWTAVDQRTEALSTPWQASSTVGFSAQFAARTVGLTSRERLGSMSQVRHKHLEEDVARGFDTHADTVRPATQHDPTLGPLCARAWAPQGHGWRPRAQKDKTHAHGGEVNGSSSHLAVADSR